MDVSIESQLEELFERRVALHVEAGENRPTAEKIAELEVYGGDCIAVTPDQDTRILEAKKITDG